MRLSSRSPTVLKTRRMFGRIEPGPGGLAHLELLVGRPVHEAVAQRAVVLRPAAWIA